jgi:hypothetical protein
MNKSIISAVTLFILLLCTACRSYSPYRLEMVPSNIDTNLLGIWKAEEDTDRANYFLVQSEGYRYPETSKFKSDNRYLSTTSTYFITYMDHKGINPHYQQFSAWLSKIGQARFLTILYWHQKVDSAGEYYRDWGYFFVRLIDFNAERKKLTTAIIADTTLPRIGSMDELRRLVQVNIEESTFYSDTMHLTKISDFHSGLSESQVYANPK